MEIKKLFLIGALAVGGASCASVNQKQVKYFRETSAANLIVSHSSDDANYAIRPAKMEGSFRAMLTLDDIEQIAQTLPEKNLAVISFGYIANEDHEAEKVKTFSAKLAQCGFKRVVFVRNLSPKADRTEGMEIRADVRLYDEVASAE
mgnify:CR=1 FL=1